MGSAVGGKGFNETAITGQAAETTPDNADLILIYDDSAGALKKMTRGNFVSAGAGSGDVVGPASATDNAVARFDTASGQLLQDSVVIVSDLGAVSGVASINKMAITAPATSSTLAVADGKTLTSSNTLTLAGTDGTTITFQGTDTYVGRGTTDTLTNKTLTTPTIASFANAGHTHADAAGGGQITDAALSAAVGIAKGGTGQTTATAAFDALAPTTTKGDLIVHNGTDNIRVAVGGTDGHVLTVDAAEVSGVKWAAAAGGTTLPVADTTAVVKGSGDATKLVRIEADGLTTGTTRVITMPDSNTTLPIASQVLTFAGPTAARTITFPDAAITVARTDAANTFTGRQTFNGYAIVPNGSTTASTGYAFGAAGYGVFANNQIGISVNGASVFGVYIATGHTAVGSGRVIGWSSGTDPDATTTIDTGFSRVAAGVAGVGTGAAASVAGSVRSTYTETVVGANVASAGTITPTGGIFHVTGTTAIDTINLPRSGFTGTIVLIPDGIFTTTTAGNIALASTAVVSKALHMTYDTGTSKWYPSY